MLCLRSEGGVRRAAFFRRTGFKQARSRFPRVRKLAVPWADFVPSPRSRRASRWILPNASSARSTDRTIASSSGLGSILSAGPIYRGEGAAGCPRKPPFRWRSRTENLVRRVHRHSACMPPMTRDVTEHRIGRPPARPSGGGGSGERGRRRDRETIGTRCADGSRSIPRGGPSGS